MVNQLAGCCVMGIVMAVSKKLMFPRFLYQEKLITFCAYLDIFFAINNEFLIKFWVSAHIWNTSDGLKLIQRPEICCLSVETGGKYQKQYFKVQ